MKKNILIVFYAFIFFFQCGFAAQADKKKATELTPLKFSAQKKHPFLHGVLKTIVEATPELQKDIIEPRQYCDSYDTMADSLNRLKLCKIILANADQIFELPDLQPELPHIEEYVRLQTPEQPTALQKPLMPLKYFNVFGHVLNSYRPQLERHPECAPVYKLIAYNLKNAKPVGYETVSYKLHNRPVSPSAPPQVVLPTITVADTATAVAAVSPRGRREALSPAHNTYRKVLEDAKAEAETGAPEAHTPLAAASNPQDSADAQTVQTAAAAQVLLRAAPAHNSAGGTGQQRVRPTIYCAGRPTLAGLDIAEPFGGYSPTADQRRASFNDDICALQ